MKRGRMRTVTPRRWFHDYDPPPEWLVAQTAGKLLAVCFAGLLCGLAFALYCIQKGWGQ